MIQLSTQKIPRNSQKNPGYKINIQKSVAFLYTSNELFNLKLKDYNSTEKKKILSYKSHKIWIGSICLKLQNSNERSKKKEKYSMFMN